jgi:hypothetical protein
MRPNPALQPTLAVMLALFATYMVVEVYRWYAGNRSGLTPGQFRRRLTGGVLLMADLLMWLLYEPLMAGRPARERLLYLLFATMLVLIPMLLAVREAAFVVRQYARWR